ncbi:Helix-turn-helix domain protein [compost metagenome]
MDLHKKIRDIRKSKGVTQTFVARQTGMTISNYNMKENGKRPISTGELELIAAVLKEPVVNFFDQ